MAGKETGPEFVTDGIFPHFSTEILPGYPTTQPENSITRLLPDHLLPGPGLFDMSLFSRQLPTA